MSRRGWATPRGTRARTRLAREPTAPFDGPLPLFRWATGFCQKVVGHRASEGRNRQGEIGWAQIVDCATGAEGPGMSVELGWSKDPNAKVNWSGGLVSGMIVRDRIHRIRLVAAAAPPGLEPVAIPSAESAMPVTPARNRFYALQWFSFAAIALIIYGGLIALTYFSFNAVPDGFVPDQDKQYVIAIGQLPEGATVERSDEVTRMIGEIGLKTPGVQGAMQPQAQRRRQIHPRDDGSRTDR